MEKWFRPSVRENCSNDHENFLKYGNFLRSLFTRTIHPNSEGPEQLEFKLEKILGFRDMQEKLDKVIFPGPSTFFDEGMVLNTKLILQ